MCDKWEFQVGRADPANSGLTGGWTSFQSSFDNGYFNRLVGVGWATSTNGAPAGAQVWRDNGNRLLLLGDTELAIAPAGG